MTKIIYVSTQETFDNEVIKSQIPVMLVFSAEWCGPCKAIIPVLENISENKQSEIKVAKLNIDKLPEIAGKYEIRTIPTICIIEKGEMKEKKIGGEKLQEWLEEYLSKTKN